MSRKISLIKKVHFVRDKKNQSVQVIDIYAICIHTL